MTTYNFLKLWSSSNKSNYSNFKILHQSNLWNVLGVTRTYPQFLKISKSSSEEMARTFFVRITSSKGVWTKKTSISMKNPWIFKGYGPLDVTLISGISQLWDTYSNPFTLLFPMEVMHRPNFKRSFTSQESDKTIRN